MRSAANPWRATDPVGMDIDADCAKFVYFLRAYYAWKNGLPFSFVNGVAGRGRDLRFSKDGNRAVSRYSFIDRGSGIDGPVAMRDVMSSVSSATFRESAADDKGELPDFYPPAISPGSIRPGTVIYDINGHAAIVYRVDPDGRIHYLGASPDNTLTRDVYGAQFGQPPAKLGGGFKNWRPLALVGAHENENGDLIGGHIELARDADIPDYSLVQYDGTDVAGDPPSDPVKARFSYDGVALGYFEYVRAAVSGGRMTYNPVFDFKTSLHQLCKEFRERAQSVDQATADQVEQRPHPARLPDNIYAASNTTWENYATPMRDARIKVIFAQAYRDMATMLQLWTNRDPRIVYDGYDLKSDLEQVYADETANCAITYLNSDKRPVTVSFTALMDRLYAMSFDPYDCIERRWGAQGEEVASCPDGDEKTRWYRAEQVLRDRIDPDSTARMGYSLPELEALDQKQRDPPPAANIKALIDALGPRVSFAGMTPIGR